MLIVLKIHDKIWSFLMCMCVTEKEGLNENWEERGK